MYDLIVIGGGPAGYCAAERAAARGMSVALFERKALGGTCLNEGCIPSKTLLNSAKALHYAQDSAAFGVSAENAAADAAAIIKRKTIVVRKLVAGVAAQMKQHGVTVFNADATVLEKKGEAFAVQAGGEVHEGKRLLIATGSAPLIPPIPGVREGVAEGRLWTSAEALNAKEIPARLAVVGGGVIGMEMAAYFSAMGAKVTVIDMLPTVGGPIDASLSAALLKNHPQVDFLLSCKVTGVENNVVHYEKDGRAGRLEAEGILLCIGRKPSLVAGLDALHVATERGGIITDASGRTNVPGVFAAGDVNGRSMLAHTAYREAECAVAAMMGESQTVDYDAIPAVIYTNPEIACVGLTLDQAKARGYDAVSLTLPMAYAGRYLAESDGKAEAFCTVVAEKQTTQVKPRRLLGVHMAGPYASEMIFGAAMMVSLKLPIDTLRQQVFPHPTVSEILREALWAI